MVRAKEVPEVTSCSTELTVALERDRLLLYICLDFEKVINYIMTSRGGAYDEGGHHLRSV
jgi:hypothetical protein